MEKQNNKREKTDTTFTITNTHTHTNIHEYTHAHKTDMNVKTCLLQQLETCILPLLSPERSLDSPNNPPPNPKKKTIPKTNAHTHTENRSERENQVFTVVFHVQPARDLHFTTGFSRQEPGQPQKQFRTFSKHFFELDCFELARQSYFEEGFDMSGT